MEIRELITKWLPIVINEIGDRVYYSFIPEEETETPAIAYLISDENISNSLDGKAFMRTVTVRFAILSEDAITLDVVKNKMKSLVGHGKLPGVQLIKIADSGDADADLTIQHDMVGAEIALTFYY